MKTDTQKKIDGYNKSRAEFDAQAKALRADAKFVGRESEVVQDIVDDYFHAQDDIDLFAARVQQYAEDAFEWAPLNSAANQRALACIIRDLCEGHGVLEVLQHHHERMTDDLLQNRIRPSSTSAAHNAMQIAKLEALSRMRDHVSFWIRSLERGLAKEVATKYKVT